MHCCNLFLGDGTGVGKGRTIAAVILHNYNEGRQKALFISSGSILLTALEKDLSKIGYPAKVLTLETYSPIVATRGVLFVTYSSLCARSKDGDTRYNQIKNWLGKNFDGVVSDIIYILLTHDSIHFLLKYLFRISNMDIAKILYS